MSCKHPHRYSTIFLIGALCSPLTLAQENLSFESVQDGKAASWVIRGRFQHEAVIDDDTAFSGSKSLSMSFVRRDPDHRFSFGVATQSIPADAFLGDHLVLSGYIKTDNVGARGYAGLWVRVDGADGILYLENMQDTPVTGTTDWHRYEARAYVADDAEQLLFGAILTGDGTAWFDELELSRLDLDSLPPPTDEATAYLENALDIMEENSVKRDFVDWEMLRTVVTHSAAGAVATADIYPALRTAIWLIRDQHSNLLSPERAAMFRNDADASASLGEFTPPTGMKLGEEIAYVGIPGFLGVETTRMTAFADAIQRIIADLDSEAVCGWIVDLRPDTGGNVFPMLAGLGPLLGEGEFGGGVRADDTTLYRWYRGGRSGVGEAPQTSVSGKPYVLIRPDSPVAVLLGPRTSSSGEAITLAFIGRPLTQTFGQPTSGQTTGNAPFFLSDGAILNLAVTTMTDRLDRPYHGRIVPDVVVESGAADVALPDQLVVQQALEWLRERETCRNPRQ